MIYLGDNEPTIYLGDVEPIIMLGDEQVYPTGPFIGLRITNSLSFEKTGGTEYVRIKSSENWVINVDSAATWLTLSTTAGTSGETTLTATAQDNQTGSARTTTLTAITTNSEYSATCSVEQISCNPIILLPLTPYSFTASSTDNTAITECNYDFAGVTKIGDGFSNVSGVVKMNSGSLPRTYIQYISINSKDATNWDYTFNEMTGLTYLEVDMSSTIRVDNFFYKCPNLTTLVINNCPSTGVSYFRGGIGNGENSALTDVYINGSLPGSCHMQLFSDSGGSSRACPNLSVASLNRIIAALPVISSTKNCYLGNTCLNKLSAAEKQVAIDKGWNLV